ncbi:MAG: LPS-assembly protein LptD, partial [Alphaproteobacteria bacterium]
GWRRALTVFLALACTAPVALHLTAAGPALAEPENSPEDSEDFRLPEDEDVLLQADEILFDGKQGVITAKGNVEAEYNGRLLMADRVTYNKNTGRVLAEGDVSITESTGEVLQAKRIELSSDLKEGIVTSLSILLNENSRLAAARALRKEGKVHQLDKAVFSACKICRDKGEPLWQIKAVKVVHDAEEKRITYRDATFELFGVPVLYTPYFSHVDPTVKRKSGILAPAVGNSTDLGVIAQAPVYFVLSPHMDLTLTPMYTSNEGMVGLAEFRHRTLTGDYFLSGSITSTERVDDTTGERVPGSEIRGHLFGEGDFRAGQNWDLGFQLELTSDDTYLRRYEISNDDRLTSLLRAERWTEGSRFSYHAYYFDGLRLEDDPELTPQVPAHVQHEQEFGDPLLGGTLTLDLDGLSLVRTGGADMHRFSGSWTWERPLTTASGQVIRPFATVRGDVYYTDDFAVPGEPFPGNNSDVTGRVLPYAGVDWRWPFIRAGRSSYQIIEPVVQLIAAPYGGNPEGIPNEDSVSFEFDDTNLFSRNKFPGLDLWEEGPRANAGLRYAWFDNEGRQVDVLVGQSYRPRTDTNFGANSGLDSDISDLVGRVLIKPFDLLTISHRFRLDPDDLTLRRTEVDALVGNEDYFLNITYLNLDETISTTGLDEREEISAYARVRLSNHLYAEGAVRRDLDLGDMVSTEARLIYLDECTNFEVAFRQRFTEDRDLEPSTSVMVRFRLLGIGS